MANLYPSAIFSPTVARHQLATARDWNYIDGWLTAKLNGKSAPPFEHNSDTLKAFLALAALNESADEERELLSKVDAKIVAESQAREATVSNADVLKGLEWNLTGEGHVGLDTLAAAGVALSQPFAKTEELAIKILDLQVKSINVEQASERVEVLHKHLNSELEIISALLEELHHDAYQPPLELAKQTLDFQRKTKLLAAKLPDLKERVDAMTAAIGTPTPTIHDIVVEEDKIRAVSLIMKDLDSQVTSYHGLPHDIDLARLELESLRVELKELIKHRDGMFEGLVERESPKKARP